MDKQHDTGEPTCRAGRETDVENRLVDVAAKARVGLTGRLGLTCIHYHV